MLIKFLLVTLTYWVTSGLSMPTDTRLTSAARLSNTKIAVEELGLNLRPRGQANLLCCSDMRDAHGWVEAPEGDIEKDISYWLRYQVTVKAEAHSCKPLGCKGIAMVELCNDGGEVLVDSTLIANYIGSIKDGCGKHGRGFCGQQFDDRDFNIIVRADPERCRAYFQ